MAPGDAFGFSGRALLSHRLRSNNSRKNIPEAVREPLAQEGDDIQADASALKGQLSCASSPG